MFTELTRIVSASVSTWPWTRLGQSGHQKWFFAQFIYSHQKLHRSIISSSRTHISVTCRYNSGIRRSVWTSSPLCSLKMSHITVFSSLTSPYRVEVLPYHQTNHFVFLTSLHWAMVQYYHALPKKSTSLWHVSCLIRAQMKSVKWVKDINKIFYLFNHCIYIIIMKKIR